MKSGTNDIVIALAQLPVVRGAVADNLTTHLRYIERAADHGADVIVFPELSLIGYEPDLLEALAMSDDVEAFTTLCAAAKSNNLVVIAGCPLINQGGKPRIGAVICFPDGERAFYAKQYLHDGEEEYCSAGHEDYFFTINGVRVVLAICADFAHRAHSDAAAAQQADVYLVSALISDAGYETDAKLLAEIAQRHRFPVLLSNHISNTGGWQTCGRSGAWDAQGKLSTVAKGNDACLVMCTIHNDALEDSPENIVSMKGAA